MVKRPTELEDPARREEELVPMTFIRAGHVRTAMLPRWVAVRIAESDERRWHAVAECDRYFAERPRFFVGGVLYGAGSALAIVERPLLGALLLIAGVALVFGPMVWRWWRGH